MSWSGSSGCGSAGARSPVAAVGQVGFRRRLRLMAGPQGRVHLSARAHDSADLLARIGQGAGLREPDVAGGATSDADRRRPRRGDVPLDDLPLDRDRADPVPRVRGESGLREEERFSRAARDDTEVAAVADERTRQPVAGLDRLPAEEVLGTEPPRFTRSVSTPRTPTSRPSLTPRSLASPFECSTLAVRAQRSGASSRCSSTRGGHSSPRP
jgi:hypothetical protein